MEKQQKKKLDSYRRLVEKHSEKLLQFAIQSGYSIEMSNQLVEKAFKQFFISENQIDDQSVWMLYQYVLAEINSIRPDVQLTDQLFSFEEDNELHQLIVQLNSETKLPFILLRFHDLKHDEISKVLGMSSTQVNNAVEEVKRLLRGRMDAANIDKRLGFLQKSYERIKSNFEVHNVFQLPLEASVENRMPKINIPKKTIFYWTASIVALITLSLFLIINSVWYQQASAEKYIQHLEESFEQTLSSKLIEMGIGEVTNEEQDEYRFEYIFYARESFNKLNREIERQRANNQPINKKELEQKYNEVLLTLQTPLEMAETLFEKPLTNNKEQSEEFIGRFFERYLAVRELYMLKLHNFTGYIQEKVKVHGHISEQFNAKEFLEENDNLPEGFLLLVDGMHKQNFQLFSIPNWVLLYPRFDRNDFSERLHNSLHEDVRGYLTLIEYEPLTHYPGLAYSIDQTIQFIEDIEGTLLSTAKSIPYRNYLQSVYTELLYEITVGSIPGDLYNQWGFVRIEYHEAWKEIAAFGDNSPSAIIMREVIRKMENQNWKKLMIQPELDINLFHYALELAISGDLKDIHLERELDSGRIFAFYNDIEFPMAVHNLYQQFSIDHDLTKLKDVSPLEIVGIYDYADDLGDPVTMWHLLHKEKIPYSLEEYITEWKQQTPIYKQADVIFAGSEGQVIDDSLLVTVSYQKENTSTYFGTMKRDKESSTWLLYEIYDQP